MSKSWSSEGKKFWCPRCEELKPKVTKFQTVCDDCREYNEKKRRKKLRSYMLTAHKLLRATNL